MTAVLNSVHYPSCQPPIKKKCVVKQSEASLGSSYHQLTSLYLSRNEDAGAAVSRRLKALEEDVQEVTVSLAVANIAVVLAKLNSIFHVENMILKAFPFLCPALSSLELLLCSPSVPIGRLQNVVSWATAGWNKANRFTCVQQIKGFWPVIFEY